jgi:diaminopimelate epimerase
MPSLISFTKMHGLGNDFVVIDAISEHIVLTPQKVRTIADRHTGVGCDQVLLVETSEEPGVDFFYRIYNADGSEAGQCGNGARCLAKFIYDNKLSDKKKLKFKTISCHIDVSLEEKGYRVNMGIPQAIEKFSEGISVDMGNPHVVFCVTAIDAVENNRGLHDKNVGFMQIIDRQNIKLRVFERGAGETNACGSGACAAVVAGITQGLLDASVTVSFASGDLFIHWQGEGFPIYMTGPAETVFTGEIYDCRGRF